MTDEVDWLEQLVSKTHAAHAVLPDAVPVGLLELLREELSAGSVKPKRTKEIADVILDQLTGDKMGNDANSGD